MIASLKGIVEEIYKKYLIIDVNGVGYKVLAYASLIAGVKKSDKIKVFTYTYVREDALELFGFSTIDELRLFEELLSVSGIGPRTALNIFSTGTKDEIESAIEKGDVVFFSSVPRLGRKNAQKIIIELKPKLDNTDWINDGVDTDSLGVSAALKQLGFNSREIQDVQRGIRGEGGNTEDKIRLALKYLGKNNER